MSHSRTNNFTYRLIFFFLAGKGGGGKKKRRHVVLLLFSLSKGNPGAAAWTWAHSDSEAGWKQDLRPRSLYLRVLRETPTPPPPQPLLSRTRPFIQTSHLSVIGLRAAPGELAGSSPLFVMNRMCQDKETAGLFGGNKSCPVTKCIGTDVFFRFFTSLSTMFRDGFSCFHWAVTPHVSRESLSHTGPGAGSHIRIPTQPSHPL